MCFYIKSKETNDNGEENSKLNDNIWKNMKFLMSFSKMLEEQKRIMEPLRFAVEHLELSGSAQYAKLSSAILLNRLQQLALLILAVHISLKMIHLGIFIIFMRR